MTAQELRIGNLVWKDGIIVTIDGRSIMDIQFVPSYAEKYSPIQLSEEWLLRCGFSQIIENETNAFYKNGLYVWFDDADKSKVEIRWKNGTSATYYYLTGINCNHVHSLQNLVFFLCGVELEFTT